MKIPKIDLPTSEITIPSTGTKIVVRPYTTKEQKILAMAVQGQDVSEMTTAVKQVINNCIISDYEVDDLLPFDFAAVYLKLRSMSSSGSVDLKVGTQGACKWVPPPKTQESNTAEAKLSVEESLFAGGRQKFAKTDENLPPCGKEVKFTVNLEAVSVVNADGTNYAYGSHKEKKFTVSVGRFQVVAAYPTIGTSFGLAGKVLDGDITQVYDLLADLIEKVVDGETVYSKDDGITREDVMEWLDGLDDNHLAQLVQPLKMPKVVIKKKVRCRHCSLEKDYEFTGIEDFLT